MTEKAYFIFGNHYARYDAAGDRVDAGYPKPIDPSWKGFTAAGFAADIDAAVDWPGGRVFFFKGDRYVRYNVATNAIDPGYPRLIAEAWQGLAEIGFADGLDCAVCPGNGKAYLFKDDLYVSYDIAADRADAGYPRPISDDWPGMAAAGMERSLDAAIQWTGNVVYFFKGDRYVRYDLASKRVDDGYPLPIDDIWHGLGPARRGAKIDAIWSRGEIAAEADLGDAFFSKLKAIAGRLRCDPEDLLAVMLSESGVSPTAHNAKGDASGLIQFMPKTLARLGWTQGHEAFRALSADDQLAWVERFYAPYRGALTSAGKLYQLTFLPVSMPNSDESTVLVDSDPVRNIRPGLWADNKALDTNRDGVITVSDLTARLAGVRRGARWKALADRLASA